MDEAPPRRLAMDRRATDRMMLAIVILLLVGFVSATAWLLFFY